MDIVPKLWKLWEELHLIGLTADLPQGCCATLREAVAEIERLRELSSQYPSEAK